MANPKVLLVDDEEDFREILSQRMQKRGLDTDEVGSGQAALDKVAENNYDAIVLDLAMPGMDGIETLEKLLKLKSDLQVIVLTGQATVAKGVQAVKMGAADFLEKPAEIESLVAKIAEAQQKNIAAFEDNLNKKISDITKKKGW
ncbi:MAG: response regulator [Candidatus Zixiibacteriota bacterium]